MKTKAVRLYGKNDLRLDEFELPPIKEDEILAQVVSDSICMSSYKAAIQGKDHKRVPDDIDVNPVIIGHELCGIIWKLEQNGGIDLSRTEIFIQPALNYKEGWMLPGIPIYIGGSATYILFRMR